MTDARRKTLSLVTRIRPPGVVSEVPPPLLVLLHGVASNELAMVGLAARFDERFVVASTRSPIELGPFAFAWLHVTFTPDGPVIDAAEALRAWERLRDYVDEATAALGADPERVFLAGFSQGGIVALMTTLTAPEKVAGAVCMSGRLPPEVLPHAASRDRLLGKPVLILHGVHDDTLPVDFGRQAARTLRDLGLDVEALEFDMGHTTTEESVEAASAWLSARLDG